ncbi:MAG: hypothetical protein ACLFS3_03150 [Candidatus Aenigmatarchaeota archaeon]
MASKNDGSSGMGNLFYDWSKEEGKGVNFYRFEDEELEDGRSFESNPKLFRLVYPVKFDLEEKFLSSSLVGKPLVSRDKNGITEEERFKAIDEADKLYEYLVKENEIPPDPDPEPAFFDTKSSFLFYGKGSYDDRGTYSLNIMGFDTPEIKIELDDLANDHPLKGKDKTFHNDFYSKEGLPCFEVSAAFPTSREGNLKRRQFDKSLDRYVREKGYLSDKDTKPNPEIREQVKEI